MQLNELIQNITLVLHNNDVLVSKMGISDQKPGVFERLIAPTMLISARWRYGQR
jgi:hypothetical protein